MATKEDNFTINGQLCHFHDESDKGVTSGHFHTYDEFRVWHDHAPRRIHVLIPLDYWSNNHPKRYPVIYMNDGQTAFWNGGLANKSWSVSSYNNRLYQPNYDVLRLDKHYLRYTRKIILNKWLLLPSIHLIAIENIRIHIGCGMFIFNRLSSKIVHWVWLTRKNFKVKIWEQCSILCFLLKISLCSIISIIYIVTLYFYFFKVQKIFCW